MSPVNQQWLKVTFETKLFCVFRWWRMMLELSNSGLRILGACDLLFTVDADFLRLGDALKKEG